MIQFMSGFDVWNRFKGEKVRVYMNLHQTKRKGTPVYSVKSARTGLVLCHPDYVCLKDVTFKVSEAGRHRVLREKQKNVHAFVCGSVGHVSNATKRLKSITYNPYRLGYFHDKVTGEEARELDVVWMHHKGLQTEV